jgi:hypothetical protein
MRLFSTALFAAALAVSFAGAARAQYELTWDKCPGSFGAVTNKRFDCANDGVQPMQLIAAFTPTKSLPRFVGIEFDLEVASEGGDIPDWWKMGIGECREGSLTTAASAPAAMGTCQSPWSGAMTGGGNVWTPGFGGGGRATLQVVYARVTPIALSPGTRYFGVAISIDGAQSTGSTCSGCSSEVCIAITQVIIAQEKDPDSPYDQPGPDDEIKVTRSGGTNIASFNVHNPGDNPCGAKVRNRTWGQVKSTYR